MATSNNLRLEVILSAVDRATAPFKKITASSKNLSASLRNTRESLRQLNAQQRDVSAYRKQITLTRQAKTALDAQRAEVRALAQQMRAAEAPSNAMSTAFEQARTLANELKVAHSQQQAGLQQLRVRMETTGVSTRNLISHERRLRAEIESTSAALLAQQQRLGQIEAAKRGASALPDIGVSNKAPATNAATSAGRPATDTAAAAAPTNARDLIAQVRQLSDAIKSTSQALAAMQRVLATRAGGQQNADGGMSKGEALKEKGSNLMSAGKKVLDAAVLPIRDAIAFESAMIGVKKAVKFDTPQQFKAMGQDIENLSMKLPIVPAELAKIIAAGAQANIPRQELMGFAEDAGKMSVALGISAEDAGKTMATWRTAFGMGRSEAAKLADQISYLGNGTPDTVNKISDVINRVGALGDVAGLKSGSLAALSATMATSGVDAGVSATGIKSMLQTLAAGDAATNGQRAAFQQLGLDAKTMAGSLQNDAGGAILSVLKKLQALPKAQQAAAMKDLFGQESVAAIAPLLNNLQLLESNFGKVGDAQRYAGAMDSQYASQAGTTANALQLAKNSTAALSRSIGETLLPDVKALAEKVTVVLSSIINWTRAHPGLTRAIALAVIGVAALATVLGGVLTAVGMATTAFAQIRAVVERFGSSAATAGTNAARGAATSQGAWSKAFTTLRSAATASFSAIRNAAVTGFAGLRSAAVTALSATRTVASTAFAALRTHALASFSAIRSLAISSFAALRTAAVTSMTAARSVMVTALTAMRATASTAFTAMRAGAIAAATGLRVLTAAMIANPIMLLLTLIAGLVYLVWKRWDYFGPLLSGIWDAVAAGLGAAWEWIKAKAEWLWDWIKTLFNYTPLGQIIANWDTIKAYFSGLWDFIVGIFTGNGDRISAGLQTMWNSVNTLLGGWPAKLMQLLTGVWDGVTAGLGAAWDGIKAKAEGMWEGIKTLFASSPLGQIIANWDAVKAYFSGLWNVIAGLFTGNGGRISAGLQTMWTSINTVLSGWPAKLMQAGVNMVAGLINGIKSMLGAAGEAVANVGNAVITRFKSLLDIKSPSRVFAQLGDYTMQGLSDGLQRGQNGPLAAVTGLGTRLASAGAATALTLGSSLTPVPDTRAPITAPAAQPKQAAPAGDSYVFNIHPAAGMDEKALAREVARQIEELSRRKTAQQRSSLHD